MEFYADHIGCLFRCLSVVSGCTVLVAEILHYNCSAYACSQTSHKQVLQCTDYIGLAVKDFSYFVYSLFFPLICVYVSGYRASPNRARKRKCGLETRYTVALNIDVVKTEIPEQSSMLFYTTLSVLLPR